MVSWWQNGGMTEHETPRYTVHEVSVGDAGLTQRPAVYDSQKVDPPRFFRRGERHLAEKLAAELNGKEQAA